MKDRASQPSIKYKTQEWSSHKAIIKWAGFFEQVCQTIKDRWLRANLVKRNSTVRPLININGDVVLEP